MPLAPGTLLGTYEIVAPIGIGGMGEVYRARDTKLKRDVALKLLPEEFARDKGRMMRFQREAEVLASLNHPNIAHLYGVEEERALVMELVEGESPKGPMSWGDAWEVAAQIADALSYAHEMRVVHRDLKPGNLKVTPEGIVKVLDFGLAKSFSGIPDVAVYDPENSPTITVGATAVGAILGTAGYMSPEQARGKDVDKRADIWAFGVVLYELLTGNRLFQGEGATDTLGAVIHKEPDLSAVPEQARPLLAACLEKDPKKRLRDIGDAWRLVAQPATLAPVRSPFSRRRVAAGILGVAAAALWLVHLRDVPPAADVLRFTVNLPNTVTPSFLALSPDGRTLAIGTDFLGKGNMQVRAMDSTEVRSLEKTDLARSPFWSPDGRVIGFFAENKLKTISAAGGPAVTLCEDTGTGSGGTWSHAGVILLAATDKLRRVNSAGGECQAVSVGDLNAAAPEFLPDGNHFLFAGNKSGDARATGIYVASLDGMKPRKILNDYSGALYAAPISGKGPGHVMFMRGSNLVAQSFDIERLEATGDPVTVAAPVARSATPVELAASVASNGTLVYLAGFRNWQQLTWFDRSGKELGKVGPSQIRAGVSLSPDGTRALAGEGGLLRVYDMVRNSDSRVTPADQHGVAGVWSPDGKWVVYSADDGGHNTLFLKPVDGGEPEKRLLPADGVDRYASDWSRDGRYLIYTESGEKDHGDIWYLPNPGKADRKPVQFVSTRGVDTHAQLSPDGRWLAYYSTEGSSGSLYLRAFPSGERAMKVAELGFEPRWSRSGNELLYLTRGTTGGHAALMAVTFQDPGGDPPKLGVPQKIMEFSAYIYIPQDNLFTFSVHPGGRRFLVNVNVREGSPEINVVTNWDELLLLGRPLAAKPPASF
jgi:serine/threonine protein kinase/Tol biopolymer transport system component